MAMAETKPATGDTSPLSPFHHPTFTVLWLATVVSNIGTWMQNAAAGWLMTGLDPDPFTVSLVQVASSLPMFLFALAGGALADIVDRRRLLIIIQTAIALLVAGFGTLVWSGHMTPAILLAFSFLAGTAAALIAPAWLSIIPQLVPRAGSSAGSCAQRGRASMSAARSDPRSPGSSSRHGAWPRRSGSTR